MSWFTPFILPCINHRTSISVTRGRDIDLLSGHCTTYTPYNGYYTNDTIFKHRGDILLDSLGAKGILETGAASPTCILTRSCVQCCRGSACASTCVIAAAWTGDMPQQPRKEGWHPESEWGAACTTLPPPMQPAARPTAEITCYHPGSKVRHASFLLSFHVFWNDRIVRDTTRPHDDNTENDSTSWNFFYHLNDTRSVYLSCV